MKDLVPVTIRYTLPLDIYGWEADFLISGQIHPYFPATRDTPAEGGEAEILSVKCARPNAVSPIWESGLSYLLETDTALRHSIEDLLMDAARSNWEGARESA